MLLGGERGRKLISQDLAGEAEGTRIEVTVDMERRSLLFGLDGQHGALDAKVELPPAVRLWTLLSHREDAVLIESYRGPSLVRRQVNARRLDNVQPLDNMRNTPTLAGHEVIRVLVEFSKPPLNVLFVRCSSCRLTCLGR